ncbi:MAG: Mrp/NBP35 family ATP-binding protein [Proteobacteria bacterium]|nr:Mrp/NBP35 family ATP-binding protein [Pseudomonadota bacterium]MBU1742954.1 Mrp/NBP35 family ATP-binding protein [Pseudomonadota bacterium]
MADLQSPDDINPAAQQAEFRLRQALSKIQHKLLVMSGKGGVGKSTVAACLALGLSDRGFNVGLMDVDLHGPSIPRLLGLAEMTADVVQDKYIRPVVYNRHLRVISIEALMPDKDSSVIWRGPLKIGVIKQFVSDVKWDDLHFLIIDSPPGTGDEPLTVAQSVDGARAIIVATPQEIALADVRKSVHFCRQVDMPILGLIENMSGLTCPHCGGTIDLFKSGGAEAEAHNSNLPFLGRIPIDPALVDAGDEGRLPRALETEDGAGPAYRALIDRVVEATGAITPQPEED